MNDQELSALFEKLMNNQCSEEEADRIVALFADKATDADLKKLIVHQFNQQFVENSTEDLSYDAERALDFRLKEILNTSSQKPGRIRNLSFPKRLLYAAVALIFLSVTFHYLKKEKQQPVLVTSKKKHVIVPGSNKATLTLSNGVKIDLADASNGNIASQAGITITKTKSGMLVYQYNAQAGTQKPESAEAVYNTIATPKGGQYQIILPDGSKVWLNAASSLKYPAQFGHNERIVELDGEGYFEITHLPRLNAKSGKADKGNVPFVVMSNHQRIEVMGTQFNVNAYTDESSIKTTLVKGAVKVSVVNADNQQAVSIPRLLTPGQESEKTGNELKIKEVNTEIATAWKNGDFQFDNEDVRVIMRKIARWYDVEVDYQGNMDGKVFTGTISKYKDVNQVLKMLQLTGSISFAINNRRISVY